MAERWHQNAIFYALDVERFQDADGDGVGDFAGLSKRIDYLAALGIDCVWLLPHYRTPNRDDGYDVSDYFRVDERLGDLGDFVDFVRKARGRGIRVMLDLVINHTSTEHPWFEAARRDPSSIYRDFYIWRDEPDPSIEQIVFNPEDHDPWTFDEEAGQYYLHRFYRHQPDLDTANPRLRRELHKIVDVWLKLGASGFRIDAAPYVGQKAAPAYGGDPHAFLRELREYVSARNGDAVLMAEADVEPTLLEEYFGDNDEMHLLLNFTLDNFLFLALARQNAELLIRMLKMLPLPPPAGAWANFVRNHDELDLERLSDDERDDVFAAFAPDPGMRIYNRGIRRRLAPMLGGDERRMRMTYSLLFALPGIPVIRYGDEIGMGDDLSLAERDAVRTPMQWSAEHNAGFSSAAPEALVAPVVADGAFGYQKVNVAAQRLDPESLLNWTHRLIGVRKEHPEIGMVSWEVVDAGDDRILVLRYDSDDETLLILHNFCSDTVDVELPPVEDAGHAIDVFGDRAYESIDVGDPRCRLEPFGYRWTRLHRS